MQITDLLLGLDQGFSVIENSFSKLGINLDGCIAHAAGAGGRGHSTGADWTTGAGDAHDHSAGTSSSGRGVFIRRAVDDPD